MTHILILDGALWWQVNWEVMPEGTETTEDATVVSWQVTVVRTEGFQRTD